MVHLVGGAIMDQLFPFLQWLPWEVDLWVQRSRIMFAALCVPLGYGCSLGVGLYLGCGCHLDHKNENNKSFRIRKIISPRKIHVRNLPGHFPPLLLSYLPLPPPLPLHHHCSPLCRHLSMASTMYSSSVQEYQDNDW